jgi:hypothetical protein
MSKDGSYRPVDGKEEDDYDDSEEDDVIGDDSNDIDLRELAILDRYGVRTTDKHSVI